MPSSSGVPSLSLHDALPIYLRTAGLAHQLHVIDVGTAVGPVVGARQRAVTGGLVEGKGALLQPVVETLIDRLQLGLAVAPVVQRSEERRVGKEWGAGRAAER